MLCKEVSVDDAGGYEHEAFIAEFYDNIPGYRGREDVDYFVDAARRSGGPVLEVACGTGRVLLPIAREGIPITGMDLSPHMLRICRERLASEPGAVRAIAKTVLADMRRFDLGSRFNLVTLPFRPFQHLSTVEDQLSCLASIHRHLSDDGMLILDLFNPWLPALVADNVGQELSPDPPFTMPDGRRVVRRTKFVSKDLFNQVNHMEMIYYVTHPDGREERLVHAYRMRYLFRFEAEHLLARCGFRLLNVYADFRRNPYGSTYPGELVIEARKVAAEVTGGRGPSAR